MKVLKNILFGISTTCLVCAILLIALPRLFGVDFRAVLTGSMTPEIPVGSLVIIVPAEPEEIQIGDDITFVTKGDKVVTHRVVAIDREKNEFTTWGIANDPQAKDAPSSYENILGVVRFHIPVLGQVFGWLATTYGKITAATVIIAAYLLSCILGIWATGKKGPKVPALEPVSDGHSREEFLKRKKHIRELFENNDLLRELLEEE